MSRSYISEWVSMSKESVLIIEDDPDIVEFVQYNLEREGFRVFTADNGETGLHEATTRLPSLILLDLMLPGIDGIEVCRRLKQAKATQLIPLVMLTAKGEESDVVLGLGLGADDYVTKPFSPKELIARLQAVLRRSTKDRSETKDERLRIGPLIIDPTRHEVLLNGEAIPFTLAEFRLLQTLASSPGRVFTRDQLLDRITGGDAVVIDRNVDVHVRSIRKKLEDEGDLILTVRGVGYKCKG